MGGIKPPTVSLEDDCSNQPQLSQVKKIFQEFVRAGSSTRCKPVTNLDEESQTSCETWKWADETEWQKEKIQRRLKGLNKTQPHRSHTVLRQNDDVSLYSFQWCRDTKSWNIRMKLLLWFVQMQQSQGQCFKITHKMKMCTFWKHY